MNSQHIKRVDYDTPDKASTQTHKAVDEQIRETTDNVGGAQANAFREGFAASSGVRPQAAETGGRIDTPPKDGPRPHAIPASDDKENSGLADN